MTIAQLKYAIVLQNFKSFKLASEHLNISQPALSLQIKKLEEIIGVVLFDRSTNPIRVTPEGELFLLKADEIVTNAENLLSFTSVLGDNFDGKLSVGIIPTLAPYLVPMFSEDLQKDYPGFVLEVHEMITNDIIHALRNGELDAGLISTPIDSSGIRSQPLFYELFYLYSKEKIISGDELKIDDIDTEKLWLLNEGNCIRDQISNICDLEETLAGKNFIYHSNSIESLIRLVDTRGGITILPELTTLTLDDDQMQNVVPVFPKAREIGIVYSKSTFKQKFIMKMIEYIKKNIPRKMLSSDGLEVVDPEIKIH